MMIGRHYFNKRMVEDSSTILRREKELELLKMELNCKASVVQWQGDRMINI